MHALFFRLDLVCSFSHRLVHAALFHAATTHSALHTSPPFPHHPAHSSPAAESSEFTALESSAIAPPDVCHSPFNIEGIPKAAPFKGCINPNNFLDFAIEKFTQGMSDEKNGASTWAKTIILPAIKTAIAKIPGANAAMKASFCLSSWNGTEIADSLNGAPPACSPMMINPDSTYLVTSLSIPGEWLIALCPLTAGAAKAAFTTADMCLAMASCNKWPSVFFGMSGAALGCITELATSAATSGAGSAAGAAMATTLSFAGVGVSFGADLYLEVPFWNFGKPDDAKVYGHFAAVIAFDLAKQFAGLLGLVEGADSFIAFGGAAKFIVRFPTLSGDKLTSAIDTVKKDHEQPAGTKKTWMQKLTEFQVAIVANIEMAISFSQSTIPFVSILPDFPAINLAQISGLISTVDPKISGVDKGAYFLASGGNFLGSLLVSIAGWVKLFVGDALDVLLPDGYKMDDIIEKLKTVKLDPMFAFSVTGAKMGFFIQLFTGLSLSCQIQYKPFGFGCSINTQAIAYLINMFKQGAEWVVAKAKDWFEQSDQIVTRMTDAAMKTAKRWSKALFVRSTTACPAGFKDDIFYCLKPSAYARGTGRFDQAKCLVDAKPLGTSSCEYLGLLYYPTCKPGFYAYGCCFCSPECPAGWKDHGISCLKPLPPAEVQGAPVAVAAKPVAKATK
jgi:hypothetical protein